VARCPWVDSTCARCANESQDDPSASSRQGWVAGDVQLASHTPESPWSGHFASTVPGRPQPAGRRLIACSLPGSTGGSAGVPPACVTASPSSTTAQAYPHRAQEAGGERSVGDRDTRIRGSTPTVTSRTASGRCAGDWMGDGSSPPGWVAQDAQPGCGLKPVSRLRQTQKGCRGL